MKNLSVSDAYSTTLKFLAKRNLQINSEQKSQRNFRLKKVLVANRGEIAKRFFFSLKEENIPSVAIVTDPDIGQSWYEFADEVVFIGEAKGYSTIETVVASVIFSGANAVYPGYGFLSENPDFVRALDQISKETGREIIFMGPSEKVMRSVGDKVAARELARDAGIPLFNGSEIIKDFDELLVQSDAIGYPVIVKLSAGGGGKGMVPVFEKNSLKQAWEYSRRIGEKLYRDTRVYLEKFITEPVHIEVQLFNGTAIGIRKCAVQRKNQKVIEESGEWFLSDHQRLQLLSSAEAMAIACGYDKNCGAGTVEFLLDQSTGKFGFLEMNTRLQVEHPVTDQSFGIDLAKWQTVLFDGRFEESHLDQIRKLRFGDLQHSIECRIYAEDPEKEYSPSTGKILEIDLPTFNGVRCDFGFKKGDVILTDYDPMIGKIIAKGPTREIAISRMKRALSEFTIRGIITNWNQLVNTLYHPEFESGNYTNKLLTDFPEIIQPENSIDELKKAVAYSAIAETIVTIQERSKEWLISKENIKNDEKQITSLLTAKFKDRQWEILVVQCSLNSFKVIIDNELQGEFFANQKSNQFLDFWIQNGSGSFLIKIEKKREEVFLKMASKGERAKIYRFILSRPQTLKNASNEVRAPFTGNFVRFGSGSEKNFANQVGKKIQKGDSVITISAMKMETTINSPFDGRLNYLIENGHSEKLQLGKTNEGLIIGKVISEGELLFSVSNDDSITSNKINYSPFVLNQKNLEVLQSIKEYFSGYSANELNWKQISEEIIKLKNPAWWNCIQENEQLILNIFSLYVLSFALNHEFKNDLELFCKNHEKPLSQYSVNFQFAISQFGKIHGESFIRLIESVQPESRSLIFFIAKRAYLHCSEEHSANLIRFILEFYLKEKFLSKKFISILKKLILQEKIKSDDSIYIIAKQILESNGVPVNVLQRQVTFSRKYFSEYKSLSENPFKIFSWIEQSKLEKEIQTSLKNPQTDLICKNSSEKLKNVLNELFDALGESHFIERYFSPKEEYLILGISSKKNPTEKFYSVYVCVPTLSPEYSSENSIMGSKELEEGTILASALILCYQKFENRKSNQIEFVAFSQDLPIDLVSMDQKKFQYFNLMNIGQKVNYYLYIESLHLSEMLIHVRHKNQSLKHKDIIIYLKNFKGRVSPGLLPSSSPLNKYKTIDFSFEDKKVFEKGKWTPEVWANFCFDGEYEEIFIPTIDYLNDLSEKKQKVGSKIFRGTIEGKKSIFYFKDSRINGGATGDKEGLKYLSAVYLAFRLDLPLYVWNDGAGANIKEGMISLNRAGEGFMLNALVGERAPLEKWELWIQNHYDVRIKELIQKIKSEFQFSEKPKGNSFIVAIGVGSSTGLDVYGSSQAAIQILLDEEESYRVLTGSQVIRSVTGENLTNYEIGGAQVMGAETGTADLIARDKIHLLYSIHRIQEIFSKSENRKKSEVFVSLEESSDWRKKFFDQENFLEFKHEYLNTENLSAGFGNVFGQSVFYAKFSNQLYEFTANLIKLRELHQVAEKTKSFELFIFDRSVHSSDFNKSSRWMNAKFDLEAILGRKNLFRIHIVLSMESLKEHSFHSSADILIFVSDKKNEAEEKWVKKISGFVSSSFEEALTLSKKLFFLLANREIDFSENDLNEFDSMTLPTNVSESFDMKDVLEKIFDKESIIEIFSGWNDSLKGPGLFTGLARLRGETVGVIADQPMILSGAADAMGTEKFRRFVEFLNIRSIPLVMISNAPGFYPGIKQERMRIQQIGGESLNVNVTGKIPVVSVVLNQNYGGRQIHAFSRALRPGIVYLALKNSIMSVMGANASFDLFLGKKYQTLLQEGDINSATKLKEDYLSEFNLKASAKNDAFQTGVLDFLIDHEKFVSTSIAQSLQIAKKESNQLS